MRSRQCGDPLARPRGPAATSLAAEPAVRGLVVEHISGWVGAVTEVVAGEVELEDNRGRRRVFPIDDPGFLVDGERVRLVRPRAAPAGPGRTASGSVAVRGQRARVAQASRIWVEGVHDAALVERIWGEDLRLEGVVVEPLHGIDDLAAAVRAFGPARGRRLGVLVDHLVPGSKESRVVEGVRHPYVLTLGHPYVDVWQAVRPAALGIPAWPTVPRGQDWKTGVCAALGWGDPRDGWRRVMGAVKDFRDIEVPLLRSVEELTDFVTMDTQHPPTAQRTG